MKLTKETLKQLIKEELNELALGDTGPPEQSMYQTDDLVHAKRRLKNVETKLAVINKHLNVAIHKVEKIGREEDFQEGAPLEDIAREAGVLRVFSIIQAAQQDLSDIETALREAFDIEGAGTAVGMYTDHSME